MSRDHYSAGAIVLHWAIALGVIAMIPLGLWMGDALEQPDTQAQAYQAFQLHKSLGLTILALSVIRLIWRLAHPAPPLPTEMASWERIAALATHWLFYFLIIAIPLTGWIYVSTQWREDGPFNVPTLFFGTFAAPHLFGLAEAAPQTRASVSAFAMEAHELMAKGAIGLIALHIGAALKHQIYDRDGVLGRMVPGLNSDAPRTAARRVGLIAGFAAVTLGAAAFGFALFAPTAREQPALFAEEEPSVQLAPAPAPEAAPLAEEAPLPNVGVMGNPPAPAPGAPASPSAPPPAWRVNMAQSEIAFSGRHAAVNFRGAFARWGGDIRFDPTRLEQSHATITIETGSARSSIAMHDQNFPLREWFDTANYPNATFRSTRIRHRDGDNYEAEGVLTIKGHSEEIALPFTLTISGNRAIMSGRVDIERDDFNLGMESDPDAEYVSRRIRIEVRVEATREP